MTQGVCVWLCARPWRPECFVSYQSQHNWLAMRVEALEGSVRSTTEPSGRGLPPSRSAPTPARLPIARRSDRAAPLALSEGDTNASIKKGQQREQASSASALDSYLAGCRCRSPTSPRWPWRERRSDSPHLADREGRDGSISRDLGARCDHPKSSASKGS